MKNKEEIAKAVTESFSIAQVLYKLNLKPVGGNYRVIKQKFKELELDTSHFTGQGHRRGKKYQSSLKLPLEKILVKDSNYQSFKLKNRLLEVGLLKNICSSCGLDDIWQNKQLNMHLDHINGDSRDNRLENLRILCPNCHSQTHTYTGRNKGEKQ